MGKLEDQTSKLAIDDTKEVLAAIPDQESPKAAPSPADTTASTTTNNSNNNNNNEKATSKPKRVRTGCLTCRERHLKCDEAAPICLNCKKSNRDCKRGMKLNFIDTKVEDTQLVPPTSEWKIEFQDESREIASDYRGGESRYPVEAMDIRPDEPVPPPPAQSTPPAPIPQHQKLPPMKSTPPGPPAQYPPAPKRNDANNSAQHTHRSTNSMSSGVYSASEYSHVSEEAVPETRTSLTTAEEVLFMQVFIEEVGVWMDSMDRYKHFSRILPFFSLNEPMLCNALLACGARHLSLVNPAFHEDRALHHYNTATNALLKSLQNPNRDTIICATAAVVLNVYEVMTERALQRMNHIAGARALIKECGWSARSQGIGLACFWLNVGMELLSCLHFNWQVAWNPDEWGVDMSMQPDRGAGNEEPWTYKMVYITAKVANFRASIPRFQEPNPTVQAMRVQRRVDEWNTYKKLCDTWLECIPQTMHPLGFLPPQQTATKSHFPEIWYVKRVSITARLFYHTAMCLLPQMHPNITSESGEMHALKMHHAYQICGIVAHVKDRGVASIAIRTIAIAAECLTDFKQQTEILTILEKIKKETGWRIDFIGPELKQKWRWTDEYVYTQQRRASASSAFSGMMQSAPQYDTSLEHSSSSSLNSSPPSIGHNQSTNGVTLPSVNVTAPEAAMPKIPSGIVNPIFRNADFNAAQHPYQNVYVPPIQPHNEGHAIYSLINGRWH